MSSSLPKELGFIQQYRVNHRSVEQASWLKSVFSDDVWLCEFGSIKRTINFNKALDDGSRLTDFKNKTLLHSIKLFLCLQTHPALTGTVISNNTTNAGKIMMALHLIDYFMVRSKQFQIGQYGFDLVTSDDVIALVDILTTHKRPKESIYGPLEVITKHLNEISVSASDMDLVRDMDPDLLNVSDDQDLLLTVEQTIVARVWLRLNALYGSGSDVSADECRLRVKRTPLLDVFMGDNVLAKLKFLHIALPGLDIDPSRSFTRELSQVPVSNLNNDDRASVEFTSYYLAILRSMNVANKHGAKLISETALTGVESATLLLKERTKERARFTSLPFTLANKVLSNAIAFYMEYAEPLVDFHLHLATIGEDPKAMTTEIPEKLRRLGVVDWRENTRCAATFFSELREGRHLYNMLEVLWGSIAIIVGTLTARRVSELESLTVSSIVEDHGAFFVSIDLRKANVMEHRARVLRPMPAVAAEALQLLARVSSTLNGLGYSVNGKLFEMPYSAWGQHPPYFGTNAPDLSRCFDRFCDYHQVECDDQGRRYYVRTHQLRRNFALLFFWNGSFGGIEVLRHFLGHAKPSMTYRYITEAVSGRVLRRVKSSVAKDLVKRDDVAVADLSQLMCDRYGLTLNDLHILPEVDVINYIEDLITSGEASIEPEFFTGPKGEEYRVTYRVLRHDQELRSDE